MVTEELHRQPRNNQQPSDFLNPDFLGMLLFWKLFEVFDSLNYHPDDDHDKSNGGDDLPEVEPKCVCGTHDAVSYITSDSFPSKTFTALDLDRGRVADQRHLKHVA
jgi:hypothetical protein